MIQISEKDKPKMLEYLHWLLQAMTLNKDGQVSWPQSFNFDMRLEVLVSKTNIQALPDRKDLARDLILKAVVALKRRGLEGPDWKDFSQELDGIVKAYTDKPLIDYRVLFPFHISGPWVTRKRWFNVLEMKFRRVSWQQVQALPGWGQLWKDAQGYSLLQDRDDLYSIWTLTPLLVDVQARTRQEAFDQANRNFELLRALFNLVKAYRVWLVRIGTPKPLGASLAPPIYGMFRAAGDYEALYYNVERRKYEAVRFERDEGLGVEKLLGHIATASEEMQSLLIEILLKYGQAMDTTDWRSAFLALWQILEAASLRASANLKMMEVAKRIGNLIGAKPPMKDLIDSVAQSRHLLVHQGRFSEEGLVEVNFLKIIAEAAINALFVNAKRFPTRQLLEEFYKHATLGNSTLYTRRKVIDTILGSRQ